MIDAVYCLGKGSKLNDFELRMSLRSISKHLAGIRYVWIVGECPPWIDNVVWIKMADTSFIPDTNIMCKITAACEHPDLTENFLFINDDHYLLSAFDAETFPYYYDGTLEIYLKSRGNDGYGRRAKASLKHLKDNNLPTKHFDIHTPIVYNKEAFLKHVTALDWSGDGYIIKSLYANSLKIEGVAMKDNKINHPPKVSDTIFSTFPQIKASITRFLVEQFPEMSKFEKTDI